MGTTARLAAAFLLLILLSRLASAEDDPDSRRAQLSGGKTGKYSDALADFRAALKRNPRDPDAHLLLGKHYARTDEFEKAIEHLEQAKALRPDHEETFQELGDAYLGLADRARVGKETPGANNEYLSKADSVAQALLKLPPKEKGSYQFLVDLCLHKAQAYRDANQIDKEQDQFEEALGYCEKAIAIDPNLISVHLQRIRILVDQNRLKEAERRCGEVLKINPKLFSPRITLARIHRASNDPDGAIEILTGVINEHKSQIEALLLRAEIYLDKQ